MSDPVAGELFRDEAAPQKIVSSETVFEGRVWNIQHDVFEYGGSEIGRDYVDHPGAVAVLAIDDEGRALLIQQYRHPIAMREWELPAGLLDIENEDPLVAAQRELAEEVDLQASDWTELVTFHTSPGGSNEVLRVFLARGLSATPTFDREEEEADIVLRWVPLPDIVAGILDGRLQNSILMIGVLAAHARG
jgi:8-oxo-dGTP pyrophosphatase MutT (NUDIX family)